MNAGVEILLQRMKDNPEDFYNNPREGMTRWSRLVNYAIADEVVTQEEKDALDAGMKEVRRQKFTETVMKELAGEGEPSDEGKPNPYLAQSATHLAGVTRVQSTLNTIGTGYTVSNTGAVTGTLNANSLTLGNTELNESKLMQLLQLQIDEGRKMAKKKHWWNKSLPELFGKK